MNKSSPKNSFFPNNLHQHLAGQTQKAPLIRQLFWAKKLNASITLSQEVSLIYQWQHLEIEELKVKIYAEIEQYSCSSVLN